MKLSAALAKALLAKWWSVWTMPGGHLSLPDNLSVPSASSPDAHKRGGINAAGFAWAWTLLDRTVVVTFHLSLR